MDIYQDNTEIIASGVKKLDMEQLDPDTQSWIFNIDSWFNGPLLSLKMLCFDCLDGPSGRNYISLLNKVDYTTKYNKTFLNQLKNVDGSLYDSGRKIIVQLDSNKFYFLTNTLMLKYTPISLDNLKSQVCLGIKGEY